MLLLIANTVGLGLVGKPLHGEAVRLFSMPTMNAPDAPQRIFAARRHMFVAVLFAALLPLGVHLMDASPWDDPAVNTPLLAFLFAANLMIGVALSALVTFWRESARCIGGLKLRILHVTRPDLVQFLHVVSFTVIIVGAISSAAILSILFSPFTLSEAVLAFSVFALCVVVLSYAAPLWPLVTRLRALKLEELGKVEARIDALYTAQAKSGAPTEGLEDLLIFRNEIRAIHTFPPNGQFSFSTAASVTFLSFLPTLIDYFLKPGG